ncbi:MAG: sulfatase-like hydrolase/transferase [Deltaproteobacteria bacterium]|nr:sulfatase-like hydrolase/transferase [Deltaproteobacteria bacterium]
MLQLACDRESESGTTDASLLRPPDVLLVTIDTARADRFIGTGLTPNVDRLAERGTAFLQAIAPTPLTLPSHASIMTGQRTPTHGVRNNGTYRLTEEARTLAELLGEASYCTGAFIGAEVLSSRYGLRQGFQHYDDRFDASEHPGLRVYRHRRAEEVVPLALRWLARQETGPCFVWVHLFDPHAPYEPPEPERSQFADTPYDGEIAYTDRQIGALLDGYRELGRLEGAMIVLTSDHGESLGQHSEATHGVFIYDATIRVPLVIAAPGGARGQQLTQQVELIDLLPTILAAAGVDIPAGVEGANLSPLLRGESRSPSTAPAYVESLYPRESYGWSELRGLRDADWKLVLGASAELYDLRADPDEQRDLASSEPARVRAMLDQMNSLYPAGDESRTPQRLELDAETRDRMAALGYIWNDARAQSSGSSEAADPRAVLAALEATMTRVDGLLAADRTVEAEGELRQLLREDPANPRLLDYLGAVLARQHRYAEVAALCEKLVRLTPWDVQVWMRYGLALEREARPKDALEAFAAAVQLDPWHSNAWLRYAALLIETDQPVESLTALDAAQQKGHLGLELLLLRAKALARIGKLEETGAALASAEAQLDGGSPEFDRVRSQVASDTGFRLRNAQLAGEVAALCWQEQRYDLAARCYRIAASLVSDDARIHFNLGLSLERLGQFPQAVEALRSALALDPTFEMANRHLAALLNREAQ